MKEPDLLVSQMREAVAQALVYVDGMSAEDFLSDKRTQQAVTLNLIVIGEIAARLMDRHSAFAEAHPQIDWRAMRGMRNRIAHGYYDIDMTIVWATVSRALPELEAKLTGLL